MTDLSDDYVAGDINTVDEDDDDDMVDDVDGGVASAVTSSAVLEYIARALADEPDAVSLEVSERAGKVVFSLSVGPQDMGRVIGRRGRTAQAIRALVAAAGARDGVTTSVDIVD
ncbi:MAG: KH domain-containing protein [Acidimicrobiales bacterium]